MISFYHFNHMIMQIQFIYYKIFNNMFATESFNEPQKRVVDISLLQDYKIKSRDDWTHWKFDDEEQGYLPLGFNNKFNFHKNIKYCDLSLCQDDADFVVVQENVKRKTKDFISKNNKMTENRQSGNTNRRIYTKKMQKNQRSWTNQIKTNFKKVTVKNNWNEIKTINKNTLQGLPDVKKLSVQNIKTIGSLHYINPAVDRVKWEQVRFKEHKTYTVQPIKTADDNYLNEIAAKLMGEEDSKKFNIICNPTFLFALLTLKAGVYPWNIEIQKAGNLIVLQSFKSADDENQKLSYLDLFTVNENTTNNMPTEQSKVKQVCITATKMTKVFHDLLASGDEVPKEEIAEQFVQSQEQEEAAGEEQEEQQEKQQQNLQKLRKYIKISFDNVDIYTYVEIDGVKKNSTTGDLQYLLIRTFMESETQGAWIKDMKTPGAMITKQYHSNTCSIQKWICEAKLAGVEEIKTGYIGFGQNKTPVLLNVDSISVKSMESTLSFKYENCWSTVKYILGLLVDLDDGTYVLAKNPYGPLSMKLYKTANAQQQEEAQQQPEEGQAQRKNTEDKQQGK